jgi:hypothetical protein
MAYDYTYSGLDSFLSRSIDETPQSNLEAAGPTSMSVAYDRNQVSGAMGDTMQVGKIQINGSDGRISICDDDGNEVARFGNLESR